MMPTGWRSGWRAWMPAVLWSAVIFFLSSIPGDAFPKLPGWWNADKFGIYAVLIATLYGITDEAHQAFTPLCTRDPFDVAADAVGGLLGAIACVVIVSRKHANRRPRTVRCRR